ncbi:DUF4352 domain-containing protein [Microbacterium sp. AG790]|uniref:DUF4352 domain-containing protein n=1 Tax=Microbacterium sp. AG790 TaxID=2183995 RepID=UPI000EB12C24|nr:DUF4352 domain-containing protein [Microbacterium sp. AG790]
MIATSAHPLSRRATTGIAAAALGLTIILTATACSEPPAEGTSAASQVPTAPPTPAPSAATATPADAPPPAADAPVAKVGRIGGGAATVGAAASAPGAPVVYSDGVTLRITDVSYAAETSQGPGTSTGREFARLTVELTNGSSQPIDVSTSVVTVLDAEGNRFTPVYTPESGARDFSGTVDPRQTTTAVYAVAAPTDHSAPLTIVVDFDALHTSAVFRGALT